MKATDLIPVLEIGIKNKFAMLLQSSPGVGKTDITTQVAKNMGYDLMISQPVTSDAVDYKGLPAIIDKEAKFLPYGDLQRLLTANKPLLCFFDDLGNSTQTVQDSLMHIILAREINGQKVSDQVSFVAATNRRKDATGVNGLIKALVSRFNTVLELEVDVESWKKWALKNNIPIELISFINFKPNMICNFNPADKDINNFACPRTITNLARWIQAGVESLEVWKGSVGEGFAVEFAAFYKIYKALANLPEKIILNPDSVPVPETPDILYALIGSLAYKSNEKNFDNVLKFIKRIPPEFQVFYIKDSTSRDSSLLETDAAIDFFAKNPNLIL